MNCNEAKIYIDEFLTGRLDDATRTEFEAHLASCPECQKMVEFERRWLEILSKDEIPDPGERYWNSFEDRLLTRIEQNRPEPIKEQPETKTSILRYLIPLAASFIIFFALMQVGGDNPDRTITVAHNETNSEFIKNVNSKLCLDVRPSTSLVGSILMSPPGSAGHHVALTNIKRTL